MHIVWRHRTKTKKNHNQFTQNWQIYSSIQQRSAEREKAICDVIWWCCMHRLWVGDLSLCVCMSCWHYDCCCYCLLFCHAIDGQPTMRCLFTRSFVWFVFNFVGSKCRFNSIVDTVYTARGTSSILTCAITRKKNWNKTHKNIVCEQMYCIHSSIAYTVISYAASRQQIEAIVFLDLLLTLFIYILHFYLSIYLHL